MTSNYLGISMNKWAKAIALRISDEWDGYTKENKEDVLTLQKVIENSLEKNPEGCKMLIGTTIIEENYFDDVDND